MSGTIAGLFGNSHARLSAAGLVETPDILESITDHEGWRWFQGPNGLNFAFYCLDDAAGATEAYLEYRVGGTVHELCFQQGKIRAQSGTVGTVVPMIQGTVNRMDPPGKVDGQVLLDMAAFLLELPEELHGLVAPVLKGIERVAPRAAFAAAA